MFRWHGYQTAVLTLPYFLASPRGGEKTVRAVKVLRVAALCFAAWAALGQLRKNGFIRPTDRVIVFNTGTGLKYR